MWTEKGDSGAPLIVQPFKMQGMGCVIGIHCAGKYDSGGYKYGEENTAVMITKTVFEQLVQFEKELRKSSINMISFYSIKFDQGD